jgi:hypothetical protein
MRVGLLLAYYVLQIRATDELSKIQWFGAINGMGWAGTSIGAELLLRRWDHAAGRNTPAERGTTKRA